MAAGKFQIRDNCKNQMIKEPAKTKLTLVNHNSEFFFSYDKALPVLSKYQNWSESSFISKKISYKLANLVTTNPNQSFTI